MPTRCVDCGLPYFDFAPPYASYCNCPNKPRKAKYMKAKTKVFCQGCEFFSGSFTEGYSCEAPNNFVDSYKVPKAYYRLTPSKKNKKNNCKDYSPKKSFKDYSPKKSFKEIVEGIHPLWAFLLVAVIYLIGSYLLHKAGGK